MGFLAKKILTVDNTIAVVRSMSYNPIIHAETCNIHHLVFENLEKNLLLVHKLMYIACFCMYYRIIRNWSHDSNCIFHSKNFFARNPMRWVRTTQLFRYCFVEMVHETILVGRPIWQRLLNCLLGLAKGDSPYIMYILQFQSCWKPAGFKCDDVTTADRPQRAHTGVHFGWHFTTVNWVENFSFWRA